MPTTPSARPNRPPSSDSTRLSVISWRAMRPRAAPIAARIAISRWRTVARTSSRLATFAHAINSTKLTAPTRIHSDDRTLRTIISCSVCTPNPTCGGAPAETPDGIRRQRAQAAPCRFRRKLQASGVQP